MTNNFYENFLNTPEGINPDDIIPENVRLYTVAQTAALLQTSKDYVYRLINANILKAVKIGTKKIRHDVLAEFIKNAEGMDLSDPRKIYKLKTAQEEDNYDV